MPDYQELEAHHLREPLTQPAHDDKDDPCPNHFSVR